MRMWNVSPELMCRKHLLGEHVEMHMFLSAINLGKRIDGYICTGLVEVHNIKCRHDELAQEMVRRGYCHSSPMDYSPLLANSGFVDTKRSYEDLQSRCLECRTRIQKAKAASP
ncbi:MAG TPA: pyrimidine dimer DNA glycosylase/endonuclease V [Candidatus Sulfotelmatobacter sp.]|nr:pyrimidine dimer DNA glycosylase/endonuclease V [Candidatus Sulfotelmatobacter sp.]